MTRIVSIEEAGNRFRDGMLIATTGGNDRSSMALTREIVRRGIKDLTLVFTPAGGLQGDMLIGAGAVTAIDTGSLTFGERGFAPNYRRVAKEGGIAALDST